MNMPVSHVNMIASVVKPMATLILSRQLYLIASLRSVELLNKAQVSIVLYCVLATHANWSILIEA